MERKPNKKPYVTPKLKEHGVVRELTQASSGHRAEGHSGMTGRSPGFEMRKGRK